MPVLDRRKHAVDVPVHQHESTGVLRSDLNDDEIAELRTVIVLIGYESDSLPLKPGRGLMAKATPKHVSHVTQCVESSPRPRGGALAQMDGRRIALAHNIEGRSTRPTVSFLEGPGANGS